MNGYKRIHYKNICIITMYIYIYSIHIYIYTYTYTYTCTYTYTYTYTYNPRNGSVVSLSPWKFRVQDVAVSGSSGAFEVRHRGFRWTTVDHDRRFDRGIDDHRLYQRCVY